MITRDDRGNQLHEPWLTKPQLAEHLAVSDRWIEMQQRVGLPYLRMGGLNRYRVSEVEAWLREHYNASPENN
ncbi:MAG TPA: helix-turn-helix domain-containing protein [Solirubrobacteraceae bacterium]